MASVAHNLSLLFLAEQETTSIQVPRVVSGIIMVLANSAVKPHHVPITTSYDVFLSVTISARLPWCSPLRKGSLPWMKEEHCKSMFAESL